MCNWPVRLPGRCSRFAPKCQSKDPNLRAPTHGTTNCTCYRCHAFNHALLQVPNLLKFVLNNFKRRFFPYYVYNIVAGLDGDGKGSVFSYDPVGSYDQVPMVCYGSAQNLIQPFLDNQIRRPHIKVSSRSCYFSVLCFLKEDAAPKMTRERVRQLAIDAFISASERETNTGDGVSSL